MAVFRSSITLGSNRWIRMTDGVEFNGSDFLLLHNALAIASPTTWEGSGIGFDCDGTPIPQPDGGPDDDGEPDGDSREPQTAPTPTAATKLSRRPERRNESPPFLLRLPPGDSRNGLAPVARSETKATQVERGS